MKAASDAVLPLLNEVASRESAVSLIGEILPRLKQQLEESGELMAWQIVPLSAFGDGLPDGIRSCWIFVIRAGAETGAERHPNSHQRSLSLTGSGTFEVHEEATWSSHPLASVEATSSEQRWVSIPPATWHRLFAGSEAWAMVSFHTVAPNELIEERPVDPDDLDGDTRQERYADKH